MSVNSERGIKGQRFNANFSMYLDDLQRIRGIQEATGLSKSEVVRRSLTYYEGVCQWD